MARRLGQGLLVLLALLVLGAGLALALAQTAWGQRFIAERIEGLLSRPEAPATVSGLHGTVPTDLRLERLALADADGVWLEVEGARIAWSVRALLRGRLEFEEISARRVTLDRLPQDEDEAEPEGPLRLPELPDSLPPVTVERLAVETLALGAPVLGEPATFTLSGRAAATDGGDAAVLAGQLARTDQRSASATLSARLQLDPPALDLELRAEETGGLLAALTGRAEAGDFRLQLRGSGPLTGWAGRLELVAAGLAEADAELRLAALETPRLELDGEVRVAPGVLPPELDVVLGPAVALELALAQPAAQQLEILQLQLAAALVELHGQGRLDFEAEQIDASAALEVSEVAPLARLLEVPLSGALLLDLSAKGALLEPEGEARLALGTPEAAGVLAERLGTTVRYRVLAPLDQTLALAVEGEGEARDVVLRDAPPLPVHDFAWQVRATLPSAGRATIEHLAVTGGPLTLAAAGEIDRATLEGDLRLTLEAADLAPLLERYAAQVRGRARLVAEARIAPAAEAVELEVSGTAEALAGLPPALAALLGPRVTLAGTVMVEPGTLARIDDLTIDGVAVEAAGELGVGLADHGLDGTLRLVLPRLEALQPLLDQDLRGELRLTAELAGTLEAPEVALAADADGLVVAGQALEDLGLRLTARDLLATPAGELQLTLTAIGAEAAVSSQWRLDPAEQRLQLDQLALSGPGTRAEGALGVDLAAALVDGQLTGRVRELRALAPLLPVRLAGAAEFQLQARPEAGRQSLALALDAQDVAGDFGSLGRAELQASVRDALGEPALEATLTAQGFRQGEVRLARVQASAAGGLASLSVSASAAGEAVQPFDLDARGVLSLEDGTTIRLEQLQGTLAGQPLRLEAPASIALGDRGLAVEQLRLRFAEASLQANARIAGREVALDAALEALPLALLRRFGAPELQGMASASLELRGPVDQPGGTLTLSLRDLRADDPALADLPPLQVTGEAELSDRRLSATLRAEGLTERPVTATLALPLVLELDPFVLALPDDGALAGELNADLQLARVTPLLPLDGQRLEGRVQAALRLAGTVASPEVAGTLQLQDGRYENGATGTVLRGITLIARGTQQRITISEFSATDGGAGRLTGEGGLEIRPAERFPYQLDLQLRQARLIRRDDIEATLSGQLDLDGNLDAATLAGRITVDRAEVGVPEGRGPSIALVEVEEIGGPAGVNGAAPAPADGDAFRLQLDLIIDAPGRVFVRGRGLESEWQGRLRVTGTAEQPALAGSLEVRRGHFDFLDRRFELRRGRLEFTGATPPEPLLELEAVAESGGITAIVRLSGPASAPEITFDSEPPLPQDEVLSRLLFDRAVGEITPTQALSLANALNRLRGGGRGLDLLGRTRDLLGIDTLDVGTGEEGGRVRAGRYIGDDVYLEVERGTAQRSGKARVEIEILPNVSLEADTGEDARSGVGVKWKYDY